MESDRNLKTNYSDSKIGYNPLLLEESWQEKWERTGLYKTKEPKANQKKFISLIKQRSAKTEVKVRGGLY